MQISFFVFLFRPQTFNFKFLYQQGCEQSNDNIIIISNNTPHDAAMLLHMNQTQPTSCSLLLDAESVVCWENAHRGYRWLLESFQTTISDVVNNTRIMQMGSGWGKHFVSKTNNLQQPCVFYSFGIAHDYSFDKNLAETTGCQGFLFDPSVQHNSVLPPNNLFFGLGATVLQDMKDESTKKWVDISPVQFLDMMGHAKLHVLKMDCEGCEYALARDIQKYDPLFLNKVEQLAIEVHVSRIWLKSNFHFIALGLLYDMLREEGFTLLHKSLEGCSDEHEAVGCHDTLLSIDYPCGDRQKCQNFLFARW